MPQTLTITDLHDITARIFQRAGLPPAQAHAVARTITAGERDACTSHGI